jgi:mitochondrial-processing peptidase subunit beta
MAFRLCTRSLSTRLFRGNAHLTSKVNPSTYILNPSQDVSQFSKSQLVNHGELEDGVIPEALKFSLPYQQDTLSNGLQVASETSSIPLVALTLQVRAGVRNESFQTNGIGHFIKKLRARGTEKRSRSQLASDLSSLGAVFKIETGKELTTFQLEVGAKDLAQGVELLADIALSTKFNKNFIEEQREASLAGLKDTRDNRKLILENIHYTAFRDHMFGQPIRGNCVSVANISQDHIKDYLDAHYLANRMVLVATGNVNHTEFKNLAEKHFSKVPTHGREVTGEDKPVFTGSQVQIRDDDVDLAHAGVFYFAPSWNSEDFYAFQILQRIMGNYRPARDSIINHPHLQYNYLHKWFGEMEDFGEHDSYYLPYSDVGLFGHYASTLDLSGYFVPHACLKATRRATNYVMESEKFRARNRYYNELLNNRDLMGQGKEIGEQLVYAKRRIFRSEVAKRVSVLDARYLEKVYTRWLWDCELALAFYGPIFTQIRMYGTFRGYTNDTNML